MLLPFNEVKLYKVFKWVTDSGADDGGTENLEETADLGDADIVTSELRKLSLADSGQSLHKVLLDLDVPAVMLDSSTPGHHHLIIDRVVTWDEYRELLDVLAKLHILEPGYVTASKARGFTAIRLPWVRKGARMRQRET